MATFTIAHLPGIAAILVQVKNPRGLAFDLINGDTLDAELTRMLTLYRSYITFQEGPHDIAIRTADAIQELAAIESSVRIEQTAQTERGEVTTVATFEHLVP